MDDFIVAHNVGDLYREHVHSAGENEWRRLCGPPEMLPTRCPIEPVMLLRAPAAVKAREFDAISAVVCADDA